MRKSWAQFFLEIAIKYSERSTCVSRQVGAVIVRDHQIISGGFNGAPMGMPHCTKDTCLRPNVVSGTHLDSCFAIHAEESAVIQAAKFGISIDGADLYCTTKPCFMCCKTLINAGIKRVYYIGDYESDLVDKYIKSLELICLDEPFNKDKS